MLIANFVTEKVSATRTAEDFSKFLGQRPERLGIVSRMYPELTASYLTESLMNVYYQDTKVSKFRSINALQFDWEIDVQFIERIQFAATPIQLVGQEYEVKFVKRYYEKYDTFIIDESRQQMIVLAAPTPNSDGTFTYHCQLIDADYANTLDLNYCQAGCSTRFMSNYHPEFHEEGYTKYQSNMEKHRNYISLHRNDISFSAQYAAMEDVFVSISKGEGNGNKKEALFKMTKKDQAVLESFLIARNNSLLFGKCNFDKNGKCMIQDPHTGRPIPMGDGILSQIERFATRYIFAKLNPSVFNTAILQMNEKAAKPTGNKYVFICNELMLQRVQDTLRTYLHEHSSTGTWLYSKAKGGDIEVGATFKSYEFMGNIVSFQVDRALSREYPNKAYGVFLDLTSDRTTGDPAILTNIWVAA